MAAFLCTMCAQSSESAAAGQKKKNIKTLTSSKQRQVDARSPSVADRGYAITTPASDPNTSREQRLWHLVRDSRELCSRWWLLSSVPCALNQSESAAAGKKTQKNTEQQQGQVGACSPSVADRGYAITTPSSDPNTSREQRLWHLV